jgi:hypothetical protein
VCVESDRRRHHRITPILHRQRATPPPGRPCPLLRATACRQHIGLVLHRRRATPPPCRQRHYVDAATSSTPPQHPETPPGTSTRSILGFRQLAPQNAPLGCSRRELRRAPAWNTTSITLDPHEYKVDAKIKRMVTAASSMLNCYRPCLIGVHYIWMKSSCLH